MSKRNTCNKLDPGTLHSFIVNCCVISSQHCDSKPALLLLSWLTDTLILLKSCFLMAGTCDYYQTVGQCCLVATLRVKYVLLYTIVGWLRNHRFNSAKRHIYCLEIRRRRKTWICKHASRSLQLLSLWFYVRILPW